MAQVIVGGHQVLRSRMFVKFWSDVREGNDLFLQPFEVIEALEPPMQLTDLWRRMGSIHVSGQRRCLSSPRQAVCGDGCFYHFELIVRAVMPRKYTCTTSAAASCQLCHTQSRLRGVAYAGTS